MNTTENIELTGAIPMGVVGHIQVFEFGDDMPETKIRDEYNHVHPQNLARVFARALSNEPNSSIFRIGLGNGGTLITAGNVRTYKTPNDGYYPDPAGWQSRLYNETYSEVVDDQSSLLGTGSGDPSGDPIGIPGVSGPGVRSYEVGDMSVVHIEVVLNPGEPFGQDNTDVLAPSENLDDPFMFDELGLFTGGAPAVNTSGYQDILVGGKTILSDTGLAPNTSYFFDISVNGSVPKSINIITPSYGSGQDGKVIYRDILPMINTQLTQYGARMSITDTSAGVLTYGSLRISSLTVGTTSDVNLPVPASNVGGWLFGSLAGYEGYGEHVSGTNAGIQNSPNSPQRERERMLTHLIFSPIRKTRNRGFRIIYSLEIRIGRTFGYDPTDSNQLVV